MGVVVELLVVGDDEESITFTIRDVLADCYESVGDEAPEPELLLASISIRYSELVAAGRLMCGLSVTLDGDDDALDGLVASLVENLAAESGPNRALTHVVKLRDPLLRSTNAALADEIFEIEMSIREAMTIIFLRRYSGSYYSLLQDSSVELKPYKGKELPSEETMRSELQNEFFFLLFSDYIAVHKLRPLSSVKTVIEVVASCSTFEELKVRLGIDEIDFDEESREFLATIRARLESVERVRNCVMHNRRVPTSVLENYELGKAELVSCLAEFISAVGASVED